MCKKWKSDTLAGSTRPLAELIRTFLVSLIDYLTLLTVREKAMCHCEKAEFLFLVPLEYFFY